MVNLNPFDISGRPVVVTGAAGLLGSHFSRMIARVGGLPLLIDVNEDQLDVLARDIGNSGSQCLSFRVDVTDRRALTETADKIRSSVGPVWGLVNNVASNPAMSASGHVDHNRLETLSFDQWEEDIELGLTSSLACAQIFGAQMVERGSGSIINIASDLAIIAPDQRIYRSDDQSQDAAPVKPASYSVVKSGLVGLTRYLSTYWSPLPVRCNALLPGSVRSTQSPELVANLEARIPLGRLAFPNEYSAAVIFLLSDASSYMTGASVVMDGGRSTW